MSAAPFLETPANAALFESVGSVTPEGERWTPAAHFEHVRMETPAGAGIDGK